MNNTKLRSVLLCGPEWEPAQPFWKLKAAAPDAFMADQQHVQEDDIHPIRSVLIGAAVVDGETPGFCRPHLVSLHLIVGHGIGKFETQFSKEIDDKDRYVDRRHYPVGFKPLPKKGSQEYFKEHPVQEELFLQVFERGGWVAEQLLPSKRRWTYYNSEKKKTIDTAAYFLSGPVASIFDTPQRPAAASFQHVLAEPLLKRDEKWPGGIDKEIEVPAFGLVTGRVELAVADGAFGWLGELQPRPPIPSETDKIRRYPIALTPDGIELQCEVSFPGAPGKLSGPFLLSPDTDKRSLVLTLLPDKLSDTQRTRWLAAWAAVLPASGEEESLHGFRIAGNPEVVPEFRYILKVELLPDTDDNWPGMHITSRLADLPVEIPSRYLRLDIVSPQTRQGAEGVVNCTGGYFMLGTIGSLRPYRERFFGSDAMYQSFANTVDKTSTLILAWATQRETDAKEEVSPTHLILESTFTGYEEGPQLTVGLVTAQGEAYPVAHDERRLAASLREAYNMSALPAGRFDASHPLVPGFIPVPDGWLQLPFPNLPPRDPESDRDMLESSPSLGRNAIDGYLRFMNSGDIPQVLSAFDAPATPGLLVKEAPWSVTLERASRLRVAMALVPINDTLGRKPALGKAVVDEPDLSMRGLLWISSDRPDELEAIPRLGAGPGAFFDVSLEHREQEKQVVSVAIADLNLTSVPQGAGAIVIRGKLSLTLDFDKEGTWKNWWKDSKKAAPLECYHWSRHPLMPLASQMPMTRTAKSAVRPLESRDMVPFEVQPTGDSKDRLAHLAWAPEQVFPSVQGTWKYRLAKEWPLPPEHVAEPPREHALQVRGIGLIAFGVPGVELSPSITPSWSAQRWASLRAALRHDLPVLDEAFATASMPHVPEEDGASQEPIAPPELLERESLKLTATALDWEALKLFWGEQERCLQLARVTYSYVIDYKAVDDVGATDIYSLVGGFAWTALHAGFELAVKEDPLPYGWMKLGDAVKLAGNQALEGLSETFAVADRKLVISDAQPSEKAVVMLGNSPNSFLLDGFLIDARGVGVQELSMKHGWWRPVHDPGNAGPKVLPIAGRFSSPHMQLVYGGDESTAVPVFRFWFKDIPLTGAGTFHPNAGVETDAWQDGHLQRGGFEWRMLSATDTDTTAGFDQGMDRLEFFDFQLEPLRLEGFSVAFLDRAPATAVPLNVQVLARLHLGVDSEDVHDGGNLLRLVFEQRAGRLMVKSVEIAYNEPLRFLIPINSRVVTIHAASVSWNQGSFSLAAPSLTFEFAGRDVLLEGAKQDARLMFAWASADKAKPGTLMIRMAQLDVGTAVRGSKFTFTHEAVIAPGSTRDDASATISIHAGGELCDANHKGKLTLLQGHAEVQFKASRAASAFCVTTTDNARHETALIEGFPESGHIRFGLIASIDAFKNGVAKLVSGRFSGSITDMKNNRKAARCSLMLDAIHMTGECNRRVHHPQSRVHHPQDTSPVWAGSLTFHGKVKGRSVIAWPDVSLPTPQDGDIPFPGEGSNGRRKIRVNAAQWHSHDVEWVLDGHEMSFDTAGLINSTDKDAGFWTATVLARHWLRRGGEGQALHFTSVDTLVLGVTVALIPPWPDGASPAEWDRKDRSTFAARYMWGHPGMEWPGRGGLGTVLQGAYGDAFRKLLYKTDGGVALKVVVLGGFVGLIEQQGKDAVPLLRLPVLMGLSAGYLGDGSDPLLLQGKSSPCDYEVAWPDGLASAPVVTTFRAAVSPATSDASDLEAAARMGARALESNATARHRLAGGLLVEQSFPFNLVATRLSTTPFFLTSAVGVSRVLKSVSEMQAEQRKVKPSRVLSLVSYAVRDEAGNVQHRAAALLTGGGDWKDTTQAISKLKTEGELMVAGDDVAVEPWSGLDFEVQTLEGIGAQVAMKAYTLQSRPRAVLARDIHGNFGCVDLPMPALQPRKRELRKQAFADAGRGYMLPVVGGVEMAGVEEGFTGSVRDTGGSGIAALARVANLPALALQVENDEPIPVDDVIWLAQQRAPIYLPIRTELDSEPIPWLVPGAPRTRLPTGEEVNNLIKSLRPESASQTWQPFLAGQAMLAAISERPGILMARHMRLEIGANRGNPDGGAFDGLFPRFGRPAQASACVARMERTPRPARLPANESDNAAFHRRLCASPLLPLMNHRAWVGPADSIGGTFQRDSGPMFPWTVTLVAAPETSGTVMQSWDGTLQLAAEIDEKIVKDAPGPTSWAAELMALLFGWPRAETGNPTRLLQASATLEINGHSLPFRTLHVLQQEGAGTAPKDVRRGYVTIVLDMREPDAAARVPGPALATIAELLTTPAATPVAELKLTVHPGAGFPDGVDLDKPFALSLDDTTLSGSVSRAPVTLRFPLWPVLRDRGALALEPTSLLFIDPAYDAGLSAPPYEAAQRVKVQNPPSLPPDRGELLAVLAADRRHMNLQGTVVLMADLRFEQRLDPSIVIGLTDRNGDVKEESIELDKVQLRVQPRVGPGRVLFVGSGTGTATALAPKSAKLKLGHVHELPLVKLVEENGTPARLSAGDMLEIAVTFPKTTVEVLRVNKDEAPDWALVTLIESGALTLRITLTDEPVAEPPPGLYTALARTGRSEGLDAYFELSLPLYAQSPLPWRVDLQDAAAGFRAGLLRRNACFVWTLARPTEETKRRGVHVVKIDRNGQTYLPEVATISEDFVRPENILDLMESARLTTTAADTEDL